MRPLGGAIRSITLNPNSDLGEAKNLAVARLLGILEARLRMEEALNMLRFPRFIIIVVISILKEKQEGAGGGGGGGGGGGVGWGLV